MLTSEKIKIYERYGGDIDSLLRVGSKKLKDAIDGDEWGLIGSFIQDIKLVNTDQTSERYSRELNDKLKNKCENEEVIEMIRALASNTNSSKKPNLFFRILKALRK